jgi:hypothetical protein
MSAIKYQKGFQAAFLHDTTTEEDSAKRLPQAAIFGSLKPYPVLKFHNVYVSSSFSSNYSFSENEIPSSLNSNSSDTSFASSISFQPIISLDQKKKVEAKINIENTRREFSVRS